MKSAFGDTQRIAVEQIKTNGGTQPRDQVNQEIVNEYAEAMRNDVTFPAVVLFYDGSDYWMADGFHRYHAALLAEVEKLLAEVHQGTRRDAVLYSVGANATHGLPRTNADKRRAVMTLLNDKDWAKWSDREVAKRCCVSNNFVGDIRRSLSSDDSDKPAICPNSTDAPPTRTVERSGKTFEMSVGKIGTNHPRAAAPAQRKHVDDSTSQLSPDDDESTIAVADQPESESEFVPEEAESGTEESPAPRQPQDRINGNGNGHAPRPARETDIVWSWSKSIQVLYEQFGIVEKKGGLENLLDEWEDRLKLDYLRTLRDLRERCDKWIPVLEKACGQK